MARGRPLKDIDKKIFENLCGLQCTAEEITVAFDISKSTLWRWCHKTYGEDFETVFAAKRKLGFISLRRTQFKLAEKSAAMAIFLGKNYLGQTDKDGWQRQQDEKLLEIKEKQTEQKEW